MVEKQNACFLVTFGWPHVFNKCVSAQLCAVPACPHTTYVLMSKCLCTGQRWMVCEVAAWSETSAQVMVL